MIKRAYKYLFYRLLLLFRWGGEHDFPAFPAMCAISIFTLINLFSFLILLDVILGRDILGSLLLELSPKYYFIPILIFSILFYYIFIHKKKYKEIIQEFENENQKQKTISTILTIIYFIFSFLFFFVVGYIISIRYN